MRRPQAKPALQPPGDGPVWEDVSKFIPRRGEAGVRAHSRDESGADIVAYDERGHLVGVLSLIFTDDELPSSTIAGQWVVVRDDARRRGWASKLYQYAHSVGIEVESGSDLSLSSGDMTRDGYDFMIGRRAKRSSVQRG